MGPNSLVFQPKGFGQPLPRNFITEFWCEADYKIPIATASLTLGNVKLNNFEKPFRPGGSTAFSSYTFLGPATESTLNPTGFTTLCSPTLYTEWKVLKSTIRIRWNGSNSGNNVTCTVVPASNTTSIADIYEARTMPFAKSCSFSVSKANTGVAKDGFFTHSIDPGVLSGFSREQKAGDVFDSTGSPGLDPAVTQWWRVFLQSNDLDVSSTTASLFQVRVHYVAQLYRVANLPHLLSTPEIEHKCQMEGQTCCKCHSK